MSDNLASAENGGQALIATSWDQAHPPEHAIDGDDATFWVTTGMFPQELVVTLPASSAVARVMLRSVGIRRISIHACPTEQPGAYDTVLPETEIADGAGSRQSEVFTVKMEAVRHVKLVIHAGWDHFVAVNDIRLDGRKLD
ncbi:hypothetical protein KFE25_001130 [Diacronema lutheri]|uniref:F5/8 type C domain-containing protein n=2 Tax=Diacronema lutheri TaxID=2081491 RepID=A0A8J6C823_DIALT|nr:hypothetical protein KFE25_001130 [Diacronema lutheri]